MLRSSSLGKTLGHKLSTYLPYLYDAKSLYPATCHIWEIVPYQHRTEVEIYWDLNIPLTFHICMMPEFLSNNKLPPSSLGNSSLSPQNWNQDFGNQTNCWYFTDVFSECIVLTKSICILITVSQTQIKNPMGPNEWPMRINNHTPSKVCDEIIYPFPNVNSCTADVW